MALKMPFEPLHAFLVARGYENHELAARHAARPDRLSDARVAEICEVSSSTLTGRRTVVLRWRSAGLMIRVADEVATRLGVHPITIWPQFWDDIDGAP